MGSMRTWATPLTVGAFLLLSITGGLMFFHLEPGIAKLAHEWLGWALVAGGLAHAVANWKGLVSHLRRPLGAGLIGLFVVLMAGSFLVPQTEGKGGGGGMRLLADRIASTPIAQLAPVANRSPDQLVAALQARGVTVADPAKETLRSLAGKDRGRQRALMDAIFSE